MRPRAPRFVEVNPMAPTAKPDHARNTGAADQRAAQPDPDATKTSDSARLRGESRDSTRVVQSIPREFLPKDMRPAAGQPVGGAAATPAASANSPASASAESAAKTEPAGKTFPADPAGKKPAPTLPDKKPTDPGPARPKTETPSDAKNAAAKKAPGPATLAGEATPGDPSPRPRPRATLAGTSGPLGINLAGTNEKGSLAVDSRFSRMGEYASRLFEIIQASWWAGIERSRISESGQVVVEFTLHSDGTVSDSRIISATTSERAALICLDAIVGRSPYDKWPEDMVGMIGEKQTGRITFQYR
jgi:outer membrane biosynthesis protein TonB